MGGRRGAPRAFGSLSPAFGRPRVKDGGPGQLFGGEPMARNLTIERRNGGRIGSLGLRFDMRENPGEAGAACDSSERMRRTRVICLHTSINNTCVGIADAAVAVSRGRSILRRFGITW